MTPEESAPGIDDVEAFMRPENPLPAYRSCSTFEFFQWILLMQTIFKVAPSGN